MSRDAIALAMTGASGAVYGLRLLECLIQVQTTGLSHAVRPRPGGDRHGDRSQTAGPPGGDRRPPRLAI